MASKLKNLEQAYHRQTTPGTVALIAIALFLLTPGLLDWVQSVPNIQNSMAVVRTSTNRVIISDTVTSKGLSYGSRHNYVELEQGGATFCTSGWDNTWKGENVRFWDFEAFTDCDPPKEPFRVCSIFSVESENGTRRRFGPFCSEMVLLSDPQGAQAPETLEE